MQIAGIRIALDGAWMAQVARNLLVPVDGFLRNARYLIHDRDPLFTRAWTELIESRAVKCVPIPAQSLNLVIFGERYPRQQFVEHYQAERYHQGIGGQRILARPGWSNDNGRIGCTSRLGGVLTFYHRQAA